MRQFVPLENSSFRFRAGWRSMVDALLQLIRLILVAAFLTMLAWSAVSQVRACELHLTYAAKASLDAEAAHATLPVDRRGHYDARS